MQSAVLQAKNEGEAKVKERDKEAKEKLANANKEFKSKFDVIQA